MTKQTECLSDFSVLHVWNCEECGDTHTVTTNAILPECPESEVPPSPILINQLYFRQLNSYL